MDKKAKIDLSDDDFGCLVNCAIRYCLGRCTYMPSLICRYVKPLLPYLSEKTIGCMERDIREAPSYGMACDQEVWMTFLQAVRQEMSERSIQSWT